MVEDFDQRLNNYTKDSGPKAAWLSCSFSAFSAWLSYDERSELKFCWSPTSFTLKFRHSQKLFYRYSKVPPLRNAILRNSGYVHTVPDRFLLRFKSRSSTVWTRINLLLRCRNCSEAFPVWTGALSVMQFATLPFDLKRLFTKTRFRCNFCSDKSVQT